MEVRGGGNDILMKDSLDVVGSDCEEVSGELPD